LAVALSWKKCRLEAEIERFRCEQLAGMQRSLLCPTRQQAKHRE
jgi:hypothetical protein